MGWQDAPEVGSSWQAAPVVGGPDALHQLAQNTGAGEAALIGAGRMGDRMYEGLKQAGLGIGSIFSNLLPERLKRAAQEELAKKLIGQEQAMAGDTAVYKPLEQAHPIATAVGEALPLAAAPMLRAVEGAGALPAIVNGAASAAAPAALEYGTPEERAKRAALAGGAGAAGSALGKTVGAVAQRAMQPVKQVETQSLQDAIAAAQRIGYPLTPGETTGSKALQMVEARLAKTPGSSGAMQEFQQSRDRALSRAAAGAMGETGDEISKQMMAQASSRIGGEFDRLAVGKAVPLGQPFQDALAALKAQQSTLGEFADPAIDTLVAKGMDLAKSGQVDGKAYQLIRSRLGTKANDAFASGNSEVGQALKTVRDAFDDAATATMTGADKQAWDLARQQWAVLKTLEKGNVVEAGKVAPGRLKEALRTARPKDYKEGRLDGPLADIATIAENFKPLPDSGTAGNMFTQGLLTGVNPIAGAASVAAPWAAQKAMFSKAGQDFLVNGRQMSPLERALMDRAARLGSLGVASGYEQ
jgi:hypothetical protein